MKYALPLFTLTLTACASGPDLSGAWKSPCIAQEDGSRFDLDFDLTDERWALDYIVYGDEACTAKLLTVHIAGPYQVGEPSAVPDAHEATFSFDEKTMTPHAAPLVDALKGAGCGDFEVGRTQDVYAAGCPAFGQYPKAQCSADYDLVWQDGNQLRFGARPANNDMCTPDKRPTALSPMVLTRQ